MPPKMPSKEIVILQNLLNIPDQPIRTLIILEQEIMISDIFSVFDHGRPLGISPGYSDTGKLVALAFVDNEQCRIVEFVKKSNGNNRRQSRPVSPQTLLEGRNALQEVLCRPMGAIYAFDMGPLAMSLSIDLGIRITNAVDIQSAFSAVDRKPFSAIKASIGTDEDSVKIYEDNVKALFLNPIYDFEDRFRGTDLAIRAWVSQFLPGFMNGAETFDKVPKIDTLKLDASRLNMIAKLTTDSLRLDQKKPLETKHNFTQRTDSTTDQARLQSMSYNNKIREGKTIKVKAVTAQGEMSIKATMGGVSGRSGTVITDRDLTNKTVTVVTSIGRDDPTTAEAQRAATVLRILQGTDKLLDESPWIQNIWFPLSDEGFLVWPEEWTLPVPKASNPFSAQSQPGKKLPDRKSVKSAIPGADDAVDAILQKLNSSQQAAVNNMLSDTDEHRICLIQGPPGTGKTSVIAAFVQAAIRNGKGGIWLVAQSNIAVKNIAEKLVSSDFTNWKILVSKDFHFEWHEHLYEKIEKYLIRSDEFNYATNRANLRDVHVVLCTLSMLSNRHISRFTKEIPLRTLVVDEASQIEIGGYIPVFSAFKNSLRKTCFIGDDKQLPPYGQEELQDLQSIFEITHLKRRVEFLDIQYRMPPQIGRIISEAVYEDKLKSNPHHPIQDDTIACYFIDAQGKEKPLEDKSYINEAECTIILKLAQKLEEQAKSYRIITPYEGQRNLVENAMNSQGLDWKDKCFNVDSFQGNEDDFIIISVVRSRGLGFLKNRRRTNVMLSRCKKGMFIVSSRQFLEGEGSNCLVGEFLKKVDSQVWLTLEDIESEKF